jgi:hypothetical protein
VPGRRTFYNHDGVCVTEQVMQVAGRRYAVVDLNDLRTVRGPRDPLAMCLTWAAAVLVMVVVAVAVNLEDFALSAMLLVLGLVPAALAALTWRLRPSGCELWADYYGVEVQLYLSADEQKFNQVCRALVRAREARPLTDLRG